MSKKREYKKAESNSGKFSKEGKNRSGTDRQGGGNSSRPGYLQPKDKRGTSRFNSGSEGGYKKDDKSSYRKDSRPDRNERTESKPRFFQPKDGEGRPERSERPHSERKGSDFKRSDKGGYNRGKDDNNFRPDRGGKTFKSEGSEGRKSGNTPYGKRRDDAKFGSEKGGRPYRNEGSGNERSGKPSYDKKGGDDSFRSERSGRPYRKEGSESHRSGKSFDKRRSDESVRSERPERSTGYKGRESTGYKGRESSGYKGSDTSSSRYDKKDSSFDKKEKSFRNSKDERPDYKGSSERRSSAPKRDGDQPERGDRKEYGRRKDFTERRPRSQKPTDENVSDEAPKTSKKGEIRLNRYIANAGICSRRDADLLIQAGEITVNGKVVTEMGYKVDTGDEIRYNNRRLKREKPVYVLLNKPKDFITTTDDPENRKTIMQLVDTVGNERIYPVGRLDRNTTGLILLTNDGELADKLSHPSNNIKKLYQVDLDKPITPEDLFKIQEGVHLEDGLAQVDQVAIVNSDSTSLGLQIHSGKNRIVRRIFEHLGYDVVKLDRVMYAGLDKKDLPRGKWRLLSEQEVIRLKYMK